LKLTVLLSASMNSRVDPSMGMPPPEMAAVLLSTRVFACSVSVAPGFGLTSMPPPLSA
jgi:hypothetical protein